MLKVEIAGVGIVAELPHPLYTTFDKKIGDVLQMKFTFFGVRYRVYCVTANGNGDTLLQLRRDE